MASSGPGDDVTLDDVVARVRELPTRLRSLYVETDGWTDTVLAANASARRHRELVPPALVDPDGRRPQRRWRVRSWLVFDAERYDRPMIGVVPRRGREEMEYTEADGSLSTTVSGLDESARWWTGEGDTVRAPRDSSAGSLYNSWVVGRHSIEEGVGRQLLGDVIEVLGRRCVRVRVHPRREHWAPGRLASGDAHLLDVDLDTGLTLGITSLHDGDVFQHYEVVTLELDPEIDAALTAPPDGAVPAPAPKSPRGPDEVASDSGDLVVFAPTWLPDGYVFDTGNAGVDPEGTARATLIYTVDRRRFLQLIEFADQSRGRADAAAAAETQGWTVVDRGERWVAISDMTDAQGVRIARASMDGTGILIRGALSADELLDVAFSLERVDT